MTELIFVMMAAAGMIALMVQFTHAFARTQDKIAQMSVVLRDHIRDSVCLEDLPDNLAKEIKEGAISRHFRGEWRVWAWRKAYHARQGFIFKERICGS